jgi:hypothetical protein
MLTALEARALERGADRCTLLSTETALYRSAGYGEDGLPQGKFWHEFELPDVQAPNRTSGVWVPMVVHDARTRGLRAT